MFSANFYLAWRAKRFASTAFAEKADQAPPEALLQQVWLYQRILQDRLQTTDGRAVRVLHPGFLNREAGPDFRRAIVQIGSEGPVTGDIEIDLISSGWEQHSHARNPSYQNVVLHEGFCIRLLWHANQKEAAGNRIEFSMSPLIPLKMSK